MEQVTYNGLTFEPYIRRDRIEARIKELGKTITEETAGKKPLSWWCSTALFRSLPTFSVK